MEYRKNENILIGVNDLRIIMNCIIDNIEKQLKINDIELKKDYYYTITEEEKYDMKTNPSSYNIGQLYEDWKFLKSLCQDTESATPLNFIHLAPVIDYLATQVDWYGEVNNGIV